MIYPYILPEILLTYTKKSELKIKAQFIESFNTNSYVKEFEIDKTYRHLSLSNREIKNRQFKDLKTNKIINNKISMSFKDISKKEVWVELDRFSKNILGKISNFC